MGASPYVSRSYWGKTGREAFLPHPLPPILNRVKINDLNDKYNVTIFRTNVHGGKAFAAEQKIRELKKRISKVKTISDQNKAKISPTAIIKRSAENMNNVKSKNYKLTPNETEKKSLQNQRFRTQFNFERIKI